MIRMLTLVEPGVEPPGHATLADGMAVTTRRVELIDEYAVTRTSGRDPIASRPPTGSRKVPEGLHFEESS